MSLQKHLRFLLGLLYAALAFGAAAVLLPGLLPFLLGWGISFLLEPAVGFLCGKLHLRRGWVSASLLLLSLAACVAGGFVLLRRVWFELTVLSARIPAWMDFLQQINQRLDHLIYRWTVAVSPDFRAMLQRALAGATDRIAALLSSLGSPLLEWLTNRILTLPRLVLFLFTALLASYFFLAGKPALSAFVQKQLPDRWLSRMNKTAQLLKSALGGWIKAQGVLLAVTFVLLATGFLLTKVEAALLLAAGIALLDALPIFGTGTVLLPWALVSMLSGNFRRGLSLVILYAIIWLTRSILEPKLIANRAGLHPLLALLAMYLGFSLFGVVGILLAPLAAVLAAQLYAGGILNLRQT